MNDDIWKPIILDNNQTTNYFVSNLGNIKNNSNLILSPSTRSGYLSVSLTTCLNIKKNRV